MQHAFDTPEPVDLFVEIGAGDVRIHPDDVTRTVVDVTGPGADDVLVEQRDDQIVVVQPQRTGFLRAGRSVTVDVTLPTGSGLTTRLGSADLVARGTLGRVKLASGSGDITLADVAAEALAKAGSGDIKMGVVSGPANISTGSGDIVVDRLEGPAQLTSGSGDILVGHAASALATKSGSGDVLVREADGDAQLSTASGDVRVGRFPAGKLTARNVSGDIVVGIPAGVPVWTDITSTSGTVRSTLQGAGQPREGQPYVELRARTVSGDVELEEI